MRRIIFFVLVALGVVAACLAAFAQTSVETGNDEFVETTLAAVSQVERISSDFIQERRLSMLKKETVVKGHFYYENPTVSDGSRKSRSRAASS